MKLPLWRVDAFASRPLSGNPAAVVPMEDWLPDSVLQAMAAENNLSETVFLRRRPDREYDIRWFRPLNEADLCGHATLASAHIVMNVLEPGRGRVVFHGRSGPLPVVRTASGFEMDFPALPPRQHIITHELVAALGVEPVELLAADRWVAVLPDAQSVRRLTPDMAALARLPVRGVGVTAPGSGQDADVDFVSRYFAPAGGVPEDPVTGALHCVLAPYWSARLRGQGSFVARQVSSRSGLLKLTLCGNRVKITGSAVTVMQGVMDLDLIDRPGEISAPIDAGNMRIG
jgi:PhzF family phenazine biosynthesis protein